MLRTVLAAFVVLALLVLVAVASGVRFVSNYVRDHAYTINELETAHYEFDAEEIDRLDVTIELGAGQLIVTRLDADAPAGIAAIVDATDNVAEEITQVDYRAVDGIGQLVVRHAGDLKMPDPRQFESLTNRWEVRVAPEIPLALAVEAGAGELLIAPHDLALTDLAVEMGAGEAVIDLSGLSPRSLNAAVESGLGSTAIYLPEGGAIRLEAHAAVGDVTADWLIYEENEDVYLSADFAADAPHIALQADAGVGSIDVFSGPPDDADRFEIRTDE